MTNISPTYKPVKGKYQLIGELFYFRDFRDKMKYDEYMKAVGRNIKELRENSGLTVNQAAQLALVKWAKLRDIEAGIANPTMKTYKKIAAAFKIDIDDLLNVRNKK